MGKTKLKIKPGSKKVSVSVTETTALEEAGGMVTEMGQMKDKVTVAQHNLKKYTVPLGKLEKKFLELVDSSLASIEKTSLSDGDHVIEVSARRKGRKLEEDTDDLILALEKIKPGLALELATFSLGDLSKYLSEKEVNKYCEHSEGNRSLTYK